MWSRKSCAEGGFTVVELLVVVCIIGLVVSLLMPAIAKVRAASESAKCMSNLRQIGQAMLVYVSENNGDLPGSPATSGYGWGLALPREEAAKGKGPPQAVEPYDYIGPLAHLMGVPLPPMNDRAERLRAYRKLDLFMCPSNQGMRAEILPVEPEDILACEDVEPGQTLSYCTATAFMRSAGGVRPIGPLRFNSPRPPPPFVFIIPSDYRPNHYALKQPAYKIFLADSGRWSTSTMAPHFRLSYGARIDLTMFTDYGAWWKQTHAYDRTAANSGSNRPPLDARIYGYRHGTRSPFKPSGSYRMNALFFDGHVESMDDMTSAHPKYWLPTGTSMTGAEYLIWDDVRREYGIPDEAEYVVP